MEEQNPKISAAKVCSINSILVYIKDINVQCVYCVTNTKTIQTISYMFGTVLVIGSIMFILFIEYLLLN